MLLKKASKPANAGFKRKKIDALGTFKEIKEVKKKVDGPSAAFASNPGVVQRQ